MNFLILGATKGMGRAIARKLSARGDSLYLLGRSMDGLDASAADLSIRNPSAQVITGYCDLLKPESFDSALELAWQRMGKIDGVILTAGVLLYANEWESDYLKEANDVMHINFSHSILFCEQVKTRLLEQGGGKLCVFSSVSGDRGRKNNRIYGATKAGLTQYLESLNMAHREEGLEVICVKPGFIKTSMTAPFQPPPFAGDVETVATDTLRALDKGQCELYTPISWKPIMAVIKRLPKPLLKHV